MDSSTSPANSRTAFSGRPQGLMAAAGWQPFADVPSLEIVAPPPLPPPCEEGEPPAGVGTSNDRSAKRQDAASTFSGNRAGSNPLGMTCTALANGATIVAMSGLTTNTPSASAKA